MTEKEILEILESELKKRLSFNLEYDGFVIYSEPWDLFKIEITKFVSVNDRYYITGARKIFRIDLTKHHIENLNNVQECIQKICDDLFVTAYNEERKLYNAE